MQRFTESVFLSRILMIAALLGAGVPVAAEAKSLVATLQLRGVVPLFCQANVLSVTPVTTGVQLNVNHKCNGRHQAVVTFSQPEAFQNAMLTYGPVTQSLKGDAEVRLPEEKLFQGQRVLAFTGMTPTAEVPVVTISLMVL